MSRIWFNANRFSSSISSRLLSKRLGIQTSKYSQQATPATTTTPARHGSGRDTTLNLNNSLEIMTFKDYFKQRKFQKRFENILGFSSLFLSLQSSAYYFLFVAKIDPTQNIMGMVCGSLCLWFSATTCPLGALLLSLPFSIYIYTISILISDMLIN